MSDLFERAPPSDVRAEQALLGCCLVNPEVLDDVQLLLEPADFFDGANRTLYERFLWLAEKRKPLDMEVLVAALRKADEFEKVGGAAHLAAIIDSVPHAANFRHYARQVRDAGLRRRLLQVGHRIVNLAHDERGETAAAVDEAERSVMQVSESSLGSNEPTSAADLADRVLVRVEEGEGVPGVKTGYYGFDTMTGGMRPGELVVLAGRPSHGKTAMALNIVHNVASEHDCLMFSLEMSQDEIAMRLLSTVSEVDLRHLRRGALNAVDRGRAVAGAGKIHSLRFRVDDEPARTVQQIAAVCRRHKRRHGLDVVLVDYLQMMEPDNHRDSQEQQLARISRGLKALARQCKCAVLCCAQLNRASTKENRRPRMSDLRGSGQIEQDADVVALVYRPEVENRDDTELVGKAELIVDKQRNGPTGIVDLVFRHEWARFDNKCPDRYESEEELWRGHREQQETFLDC